MGNIPSLPALQFPQQPDLIGNYERALQLKNMLQNQPLQQQALQQQVQSGQLNLQQQQQDMAARQALNQAYAGAVTKNSDGTMSFDPDKLQQGLANGPAAYQTPQVMKGVTEFQKSKVDLQTSVTELQQKGADLIGSAASAVKAANYDPTLAHSLLDSLPQSPQINQIRQAIDSNPQQFKQMIDSAIQNSPAQQKMMNEQKVAQIRSNTPDAQQMNDWIAKNPGKGPADYQQFKVNQGVQADIAKETNPQVIGAKEQVSAYDAKVRQTLQDGDPRSAAQLLISGDVAPSQIISARKPEFAQQAFQAAHDLSGGTWNAQSAEANFKVASSPANVAFFGSAKSLTDKGGTLDQLANAAKDIPQGQFPVFNSMADAAEAASGSGPIAKYASLAVGVADDYAKVMGGGTGSDSARAQALQLISAKQSPNQRAGSIEGIRGAVTSQATSRIGNNPVLQRMWGSPSGASQKQTAQPQSADVQVKGSDGKMYWGNSKTKQVLGEVQ